MNLLRKLLYLLAFILFGLISFQLLRHISFGLSSVGTMIFFIFLVLAIVLLIILVTRNASEHEVVSMEKDIKILDRHTRESKDAIIKEFMRPVKIESVNMTDDRFDISGKPHHKDHVFETHDFGELRCPNCKSTSVIKKKSFDPDAKGFKKLLNDSFVQLQEGFGGPTATNRCLDCNYTWK